MNEQDTGKRTGKSEPEDDEADGAGVPVREEIGGVSGPEPTRYGDWEHGGRCTDF